MARTSLIRTMLIVVVALGAASATHAQQAAQGQVAEAVVLQDVPPQVAMLLDTFADAGGTGEILIGLAKGDIGVAELDQLWQTGMIWDEVYRDGPANLVRRDGIYPDANTLINYAQTDFANANYASAEDKSNKPLEKGELFVMLLYLEQLSKGKSLKPAQMAELMGWLERFNKFPPKVDELGQIEQLQKLLKLLKAVAGKVGAQPVFKPFFKYLNTMMDLILAQLTVLTNAYYAQFELMMRGCPAGTDPKDFFDQNKGGFPPALWDYLWLRWQVEQFQKTLGALIAVEVNQQQQQ